VRDDRERLLDIQEALERIERYAVQGRERFAADELVETWIVHHLQVIGEAAAALSVSLRDRYPQVPWQKIIRMRHVLVHHYFGVDVDLVWLVVEQDLPGLRATVAAMLESLPPEEVAADPD
jgi:uncharacterized protein with HEPN domain